MSRIHKTTSSGFIIRETGSEGPRHDPYSFTEYTIKRGDILIVVHVGLSEWIKSNDMPWTMVSPDEAVRSVLGISMHKLERIMHTMRCPDHGTRWIISTDGMPGETFYMCDLLGCGNIVGTSFDISVVE